ncbi:Ig-like domain-containing protein [Halobacteria archaeon HArc-gm2]|nr:Ig-like domain-containing protein [Halobacteria archaeon HArc-gm2]
MTPGRPVRVLAMTMLLVVASFAPVVQPVGVASAANAGSGSTNLVTDCQTISTPGHYTLANDVSTSDSSNCVQIDTDDVTFDGNGHVITYVGSGNGPSAVSVSGGSNFVVRNVTTRYFSTGVRLYGADDGEVTRVTVEPESSSNDPGANANGIALYAGSDNNLIRNNAIDKPGQWGDAGTTGSGILVVDSHDNVLVGNDVWNPSDVGIQLDGAYRNNLTNNVVQANSWDTQRTVRNGIRLDSDSNGTTLHGNYVYGQSSSSTQALQDGIHVASDDNVLTSNYVQSAYWSGVVVYGVGNELDGNTATGNVEHGFEIRSTDVVLTNNLATSNRYSGLYLDGTTAGTVLNNTASGNSDWDVELVATAGLDAENTALSSGGPGVTLRGASATIKGVIARPTPDDMDHVGQFFEVSRDPTVDVSYTDAAAAGVAEENLSLWHYDGSSWSHSGGSVDTAANVVSGSVTSGIYAPLANDTQVPTISNFDATSPTNGELRVSFDADEQLDAIAVTLANESGTVTTLDAADFTESGDSSFTYENTSTLSPGSYDVTLATAADAAGNDGANGEMASATVSGVFEITAFDAVDARDGDRIVTDGDVVALSATVTGQNVTSVTTDASSFGGGHVTYSDPDGDGIYEGTFTVDRPYNLEYLRGLSVTATDDLGRTATATTTLDLDTTVYVDDVVVTDLADGDGSVGHGDSVRVSVEVTDFSDLTVVGGTDVLGVPNVTLVDQGNGWYNATVTVDAATADPDGLVYVWANATDAAGNSHERRSNYMFIDTGDLDPPTVTDPTATNLEGPDDDVDDGDQIALSVNATDGLGVDEVTADASAFGAGTVTLTDGDGDGVYEGTFTVDTATASPDGAYGVEISAYNVRNRRSIETTNELTLDTPRDLTAPTISSPSFTEPLDDGWVTGGDSVAVRATVTDAKSGVATVELDARDLGGGNVTLSDPDGDDVYEGSFTVDAANAAPDGYQSLTLRATDVDGNVDTRWLSLRLDRAIESDATAPTINEFDVYSNEGRILVQVNASESLSDLDVTIRNESGVTVATLGDAVDGGNYGSYYEYFLSHTPAADGDYDVTLERAVDRAGNDGAAGESKTVTVGGGIVKPPVSEPATGITVSGQLREAGGAPAAGDYVVLVNATDTDQSMSVPTDSSGNFSATVPKGPTYVVVYVQQNGSGGPGPVDGSPDVASLGTVDDNATIDRTLPSAAPLTVTVVRGDTGGPVANATVGIAPDTTDLLGIFEGPTDSAGHLNFGASDRDAIEVAGTVHLRATPPAGTNLTANRTAFDVDGPTDVTVVLGAPTASNRAPVAVADSYSVDEGETLSVDAPGLLANDLDPNGDSLRATQFGQPDNGTVSLTSDGSFEYVPDPGFTGTDAFTYLIRDEHDEDSAYATVTIAVFEDPNRAPTAVDDHYTTDAGVTLTVSAPGLLANDYDPDGDSLRTVGFSQPDNGTASLNTAGELEYVPDPGFTGTDSFTYLIEDDSGTESGYATVTVDVAPDPNRAPTAVDDHYTTDAGVTLTVSAPGLLANDYDPDGDSLRTVGFSQPDNGTASLNTAGELEYVPDSGFTGTDAFSYLIEDDSGTGSGYATVTIDVTGSNRAPTAVDDQYSTLRETNLTVSAPGLLANDYDPDGDTLRTVGFSQPDNGTASLNTAGELEYVPDPGFAGTDTFSYLIEDDSGTGSGYATVSVTVVDPTGTAPVAVDDSYTTVEGVNLSVAGPGVLANDLDPNGDSVDAVNFGTPGNGTVSLTSDGSFEYVPDTGFTGTDTFSYRIQDANSEYSGYATVSIDVQKDPNRTPVAVPDYYTTVEGVNLTVSAPGLLANDYDPDGDSLRTVGFSQPDNGTASLNTAGELEYVPDPGFAGTDTFSYLIEDDSGTESGYATVTVEVFEDPNRAPVAAPDYYTTDAGVTLTVSAPGLLANDYDPDGDSLRTVGFSQPDNGTASLNTAGELEYVPDPGFAGTDTFSYLIEDDSGTGSGYATVTVDVVGSNRAPTAVDDHYATLEGENVTVRAPGLLANDYDPDGDTLRTVGFSQPDNGTASLNTAGELEYVPDPGFAGTDTFSYLIEDDSGSGSGYATVSVTVVDVTQPRRAAVDTNAVDFGDVTVGGDASATVTVTNVGGTPLTLSGIGLTSSGTTPFQLVDGAGTTVLATGESREITVAFEPNDTGTATGTLRVHTDDSTRPTVDVSLSGTGVAASGNGGGSSTGSGGSSSGSNGASGSAPTPGPRQTTVVQSSSGQTDVAVTNARNGTAVSVNTSGQTSGNVSLDGLDITPLVDGDFTLNVSASESTPSGAPSSTPAGETPIAYLNVDHSIADGDIGEVTFRFRVSNATLADRGLAPADVVVYRYHDGQWGAATMNVTAGSADEYVVEATVPGLSVFAVGTAADAATETPTPAATATPPPTTDGVTPTPEIDDGAAREPIEQSGVPVGAVLGVLALVGVVVAAWFTRR